MIRVAAARRFVSSIPICGAHRCPVKCPLSHAHSAAFGRRARRRCTSKPRCGGFSDGSLHDPRGFSSVSVDLVSRMMELEDADRQLGIVTWNVTRALRTYLKARLQGARCADSVSDGLAVERFNFELVRRKVAAELRRAALIE